MVTAERQQPQLQKWQEALGLSSWQIVVEKISPWRVTNADGRPNGSLVGIRVDDAAERCATLIHTRKLGQGDIVHELLHLANPDWSHEQVEIETQRLIKNYNRKP